MVLEADPGLAGSNGTDRADPVVIIGAGPAGLTAALELVRRGQRPVVLEAGAQVGGIARTEEYGGYRFDIGGHRFYTTVLEVQELWRQILGDDLLTVPRRSRIYRERRYFSYPLEFFNALSQTGPVESVRIVMSYLAARLRPRGEAETFEDWVVDRFGRRLFETFFKSYTEKVWGIPCHAIGADWAAQRIRSLSLYRAISHAILGNHASESMVREFQYPARGPGMLWERCRDLVEHDGGSVLLESPVAAITHAGGRVQSVTVGGIAGHRELPCSAVISSMPLGDLVECLIPAPPPSVVGAGRAFRHRAIVVVGLIVRRRRLFPDQWIYVHDPEVRVGRIQNYKNWSAEMCADDSTTNLGLEYFCDVGDHTWGLSDHELIALATSELAELGLASPDDVVDGVVFRQSKAYPVYDDAYRSRVAAIRSYLQGFDNLHTVGRNGLHRYNNQDHSMVTALRAVDCLYGERHDVWEVNTERSYQERSAVVRR